MSVACTHVALTLAGSDHGDLPRALPAVPEIDSAAEVFQFEGTAARWWDYDAVTKRWGWTRPPPESQKSSEEVCQSHCIFLSGRAHAIP